MNTKQCPLCGNDNFCEMTRNDGNAEQCWCLNTHIPSSLLATISEADRNQRCVCQVCAEKANALAHSLDANFVKE